MLRRRGNSIEPYLQRSREWIPDGRNPNPEPVFAIPRLSGLIDGAAGGGSADRVPDLLHPAASMSLDWVAAGKALEFAFTAGDSAGIASHALSTAAIAETTWRSEAFGGELFIDELIDGVLRFKVNGRSAPLAKGWLRKLLCHPPRSRGTVEFRQAILRELSAQAALRDGLIHTYACTVHVLQLLDQSAGQSRYDLPRWRLDLLRGVRAFFDSLAGAYDSAQSGLSRLQRYGALVRASQGYRNLCALLDFESDMAEVDLRLRIGTDGAVRSLDIIRSVEHPIAPFYRGPWARLLRRIVLFVRGHRIHNDELVERWFDHVFAGVLDFLPAVLQLRGDLEFYLCACHFRQVGQERGLNVCIPEFVADGVEHGKRLERLFNPLLLLQRVQPVPCSLELEHFERTYILTGPNSGGKTRLLQAIALCQLLGQSGFFVAAERAVLRHASGMFVSLGQEVTAAQHEGRLGTELLRIRRLFEQALPGSMILLDELCSGTNPSEGEEIFRLVVDLLRLLRPEVYVTTHFLQFAAQLVRHADALNLSFLQVELDAGVPTYQFVAGVAETSLAQQTAARLGVSREELLSLIRRQHRDA